MGERGRGGTVHAAAGAAANVPSVMTPAVLGDLTPLRSQEMNTQETRPTVAPAPSEADLPVSSPLHL